jgi:hypothetical protein
MAKTKSYGKVTCLWCSTVFEKTRANQIYCQQECCRKATNKKIIDRYHANKATKELKNRRCTACDAKLSKYNMEPVCNLCQSKQKDKERIDILRKLGFSYEED